MIDRRVLGPVLLLVAAVAGCKARAPENPPPAPRSFDGLPVMGDMASATAAGFGGCLEVNRGLRCHKNGVTLVGTGPYDAAVDLLGDDGAGGFDHLTLWHPSDQGAILAVGDALKRAGWHSCLKGEQEDYTRAASSIRIAIDAAYWGKRRVVITDEGAEAKPRC